MYDTPYDRRLRWEDFTNASGLEIPAYGCIRITNSVSGVYVATRPDGSEGVFAFNGPQIVAVDGYGQCTQDFPTFALYDSSEGTPTNGARWTSGNDTFKLVRSGCGSFFKIVGDIDTTNTIVKVVGGGKSFWARITDRDAVTCDTGSSGSQSGSNDIDYTYYVYSIHSVHAVDDGHGCPAWVNDEPDVAIISEAVYEVNGNTVAVGTIVEVESVTYNDESLSGSEAESGSNSGSDNVGPAGCRLVFSHEGEAAEATGPCLEASDFTVTSLDCQNNYFKRKVYQTLFGPSIDTGCWGLGPAHLVATFTTTWCCNPCGNVTNNSGSESGGDPETCDPCDGCGETYCLTLDTGNGAMQCGVADIGRALDGKTVEMTNIQCQGGECACQSTWSGETTFEWDGYRPQCDNPTFTYTLTTTIWARLYRFCQCEGSYTWVLYAGQISKRNGQVHSAFPFITVTSTDGYAGYALGTNASPTTPAATSGPIYYGLGGTFSLAVGGCPDDTSGSEVLSGSQSGSTHAGDCPCQWIWSTSIGPWTNIYASGLCGDPCLTTPSGNGSFAGEVRNTNCDGTPCDDGGGGTGPTCASCSSATNRTATVSGGTGFLASPGGPAFTLVPVEQGGITYWTHSAPYVQTTCGAQAGIIFWCENNRWYCALQNAGIAFEANAGNTCASATFSLTYDGSNLLCPAMTGSVTITVTT